MGRFYVEHTSLNSLNNPLPVIEEKRQKKLNKSKKQQQNTHKKNPNKTKQAANQPSLLLKATLEESRQMVEFNLNKASVPPGYKC